MNPVKEIEGRSLFGFSAEGYDQVRPPYPQWMFHSLVEQLALYPGAVTLEIGAGNGLATRQLVSLGASPLTIVEPDQRFAPMLDFFSSATVIHEPFENSAIESGSVDLAVIATAFHWLDPIVRVRKLAQVVKPGGFVALLWNVFQNPNLPDAFQKATSGILGELPDSSLSSPPFALDRKAREGEFLESGEFKLTTYKESHWTFTLTGNQIRQLYSGFSNIARLPDQKRAVVLSKLVSVAEKEFGGVAERNMTSPLYIFQRI